MTLAFRNVDADPADPVRTWPFEALVTAIERGTVRDWARISVVLKGDPWGDVARAVEDYLSYADRSGATQLLRRAIDQARANRDAADRARIAARVRALVADSHLTAATFAARAGTSASRLSTYVTGKVAPSATTMLRLERVAQNAPRQPGAMSTKRE